MCHVTRCLCLAIACLASPSTWAASPSEQVNTLLEADTAPPGVVFEVISGDESHLMNLLPAIREHARRLRQRFPRLSVAVLSHGSEQFSLLQSNAGQYAGVHALAAALDGEEDMTIQVCGNHASWRGKDAADFPGYVNVVNSAGAALEAYRAAGYVLIVM